MTTQPVTALVAAAEPQAYQVSVGAGAVVLAAALVGLAALAWLWRSTAPTSVKPGPAGMELGPETPAVVDLLTGGFVVEDDAVPATVVDLAARGWFTIEDQGPQVILRTRTVRPVGDSLTAYEQRVLDHIEGHAKSGTVPAPVLTLGPSGVSKRWVKAFRRDVVAAAQAAGLCKPRWTLSQMASAWGIVAAIALPIWFAFATSTPSFDVADWMGLGNLFALLAIVVEAVVMLGALRIASFHAQTDTAAGTAASAHWLGVRAFYRNTGEFESKPASSVAIWDRHLAYATALGLAPEVERQIPFETEHNRHAWSHETGAWRRVKVRYRSLIPGRGRHPVLAVLVGVIFAAICGALTWAGYWLATVGDPLQIVRDRFDATLTPLTDSQRRWFGLSGLAGAVLFGLLGTLAVLQLLGGLADLFRRRTRTGTLVRRRMFGGGDDSEPTYHLAVDDGSRDDLLAFKVRPTIYSGAQQGARVTVTYSPWLGYVKSLTVIEAAPVAATAPTDASAIEAALVTASYGFARALVGRIDPTILDQVGPDGKSLREHLGGNQAALEQLRSDPRVAQSAMSPIIDQLIDGGNTST